MLMNFPVVMKDLDLKEILLLIKWKIVEFSRTNFNFIHWCQWSFFERNDLLKSFIITKTINRRFFLWKVNWYYQTMKYRFDVKTNTQSGSLCSTKTLFNSIKFFFNINEKPFSYSLRSLSSINNHIPQHSSVSSLTNIFRQSRIICFKISSRLEF